LSWGSGIGLILKFVLALINSKLLNYWYTQKFSTLSVAKNAILMLPIRRIDFNNHAEKKVHDDLVTLVDRMLELNKRLGACVSNSLDQVEKV
jgi:hypothetical protein